MLQSLLLNDLQLLSNEIKKKETDFKKEIDQSINLIKENSKDLNNYSDEVVKPFITGLKSKKQKIITISLNGLIQLSSNFTLKMDRLEEIIGILSSNFETSFSNPTIHLKVLQLIVALLSSNRYKIHDKNLYLCISLCFKCLSSKDPYLHQASCASISQVFTILLDKTIQLYKKNQENINDKEIENEFTLYSIDTSRIFIDICAIINDNQTSWINHHSNIYNEKLFYLQLIENLLENHDDLCHKVKEYEELFEQNLVPFIIDIIKSGNDFTFLSKALDISYIIIEKHYNVHGNLCSSIIDAICNNIDSNNLRWVNILTFKFISKFSIMKGKLLLSILKTYDSQHQSNILNALGDSICKTQTYIQNILSSWKPEDFVLINEQNILESVSRTQESSTNITRPQLLTVILNILNSIGNILLNLIESNGYNEFIKESCIVFIKKQGDSILNILSLLMERSSDDDLIQNILKSYQTFTRIYGELELRDILNSFLISLAKFSNYNDQQDMNTSLTKKNIAVLRTILNIAHCMGNILGESWYLVLEPLKQLYITIHTLKKQLKSEKLTPPSKDEIKENKNIPTKEEYDIISKALDSLFTTSSYINDTGLIDIVKALKSFFGENLRKSSSSCIIKQYNLFGFLKLIQILNHNLHRFNILWPLINRSILEGCNHPNSSIRETSMNGAFSFIKNGLSALISKSIEWKDGNYEDLLQSKILELIESMMGSKFEDVRLNTLKLIHQIILSYDQALTFGWNIILSILLNVSVSNESSFISAGFKSVNSIVNEYLSSIPQESLSVLISIIGNISGKKLDDVNINISAVGLLWNLADFIATLTNNSVNITDSNDTIKNNFIDSLWLSLFHEVSHRCKHESPKIRHCSLHTLYGILKTHGNIFDQSMWLYITENFLIEFFTWTRESIEKLPSIEEKDDKEVTDMKKSLFETQSILINHFSLIFKTYFVKISKLENFKELWMKFIQFIITLSQPENVSVMISAINALKYLFLALYENRDKVDNTIFNPLFEEAWYTWQQMVLNKSHIFKSHRIVSCHVESVFTLFKFITDSETKTFPTIQDLYEQIDFNDKPNINQSILDIERLFNILKYITIVPIESFLEFTVLKKETYPMMLSIINTDKLKILFPQIVSMLLLNLSAYMGLKYESKSYVISNEIVSQFRNYDRKVYNDLDVKSINVNGDLLHLSEVSLKFLHYIWNKLNNNQEENSKMKAEIFIDIQKVIGTLIQLKYIYTPSPIWKSSLELYIEICKDALKLFRNYESIPFELDENGFIEIWDNIIHSVKSFIIQPLNDNISQELKDIILDSHLKTVNFIENLILLCPPNIKIHDNLFDLIINICDTINDEEIMKSSYNVLFNLLNLYDEDKSNDNFIISRKSLSTIIKRSNYLLNQIITYGNDNNNDEIMSKYTNEVIFILSYLVHRNIDVNLWEDETDNDFLMKSTKRHLWELFVPLSECITIKEFKLKPLLKEVFIECSKELGIYKPRNN